MFKKLLTTTLIATTLLASGGAYAKDHSHNNRWDNNQRNDSRYDTRNDNRRGNDRYVRDNDRVIIQNYYGNYKPRGGYPKYYRNYGRGQYMPSNVRWSYLPDNLGRRLHHYNNARYVVVDRDVYLVDTSTRLILDIIALATLR